MLSLTSGGRKNKRTELDDRRLALCYEKFGLVSTPGENVGRYSSPPPGFSIIDFRW